MMFPREHVTSKGQDASLENEPFIVPLAIPILTGPGTISTIMIFAGQDYSMVILVSAIFLAWIPSLLALMFSSYLQQLLGEKVLIAIERLMGMVLLFIAMQMFTTGVSEFSTFLRGLIPS